MPRNPLHSLPLYTAPPPHAHMLNFYMPPPHTYFFFPSFTTPQILTWAGPGINYLVSSIFNTLCRLKVVQTLLQLLLGLDLTWQQQKYSSTICRNSSLAEEKKSTSSAIFWGHATQLSNISLSRKINWVDERFTGNCISGSSYRSWLYKKKNTANLF